MSSAHQQLTDFCYLGAHLLGNGFSAEGKAFAVPFLGTDVGEAEEVESIRLPLVPFGTVFNGETSELNEPGFPLVQFKAEFQGARGTPRGQRDAHKYINFYTT